MFILSIQIHAYSGLFLLLVTSEIIWEKHIAILWLLKDAKKL